MERRTRSTSASHLSDGRSVLVEGSTAGNAVRTRRIFLKTGRSALRSYPGANPLGDRPSALYSGRAADQPCRKERSAEARTSYGPLSNRVTELSGLDAERLHLFIEAYRRGLADKSDLPVELSVLVPGLSQETLLQFVEAAR